MDGYVIVRIYGVFLLKFEAIRHTLANSAICKWLRLTKICQSVHYMILSSIHVRHQQNRHEYSQNAVCLVCRSRGVRGATVGARAPRSVSGCPSSTAPTAWWSTASVWSTPGARASGRKTGSSESV